MEHSLERLNTVLKSLIKIQRRKKKFGINSSFKQNVAFYTTYNTIFDDEVFIGANYKKQEIENTFQTEEEKFEFAEKILREYTKAQYVVTSRIHCALPCLAMGVPVLFVYPKDAGDIHNCRFNGLIELFNTIEIEGSKIICNVAENTKLYLNSDIKNKNTYKKFASDLKKKCLDFWESHV